MRNTKTEEHDFYCIQCGKKALSLPRKISHKYQKHHYKKLWCYHCGCTINTVECRNDEEVKEFKEKWLNGDYQEEIKDSLIECQRTI